MKLLSEYMSDDESKTAKIYYCGEKEYSVIVRSDTGTHYTSKFKSLMAAEDFAEDWILKK